MFQDRSGSDFVHALFWAGLALVLMALALSSCAPVLGAASGFPQYTASCPMTITDGLSAASAAARTGCLTIVIMEGQQSSSPTQSGTVPASVVP